MWHSFLPCASLGCGEDTEGGEVASRERIYGDRAGSRWGLVHPPSAEQAGSCSRLALEPGPDAAAAAGWMPDSPSPRTSSRRWQEQHPWAEPRHVPSVGQPRPALLQSPEIWLSAREGLTSEHHSPLLPAWKTGGNILINQMAANLQNQVSLAGISLPSSHLQLVFSL